MFNKSIIALAIAAGTSGMVHAGNQDVKTFGWQHKVNHVINAELAAPADSEGRSRYIVQLVDFPTVMHASQLMQKKGSSALRVKAGAGAKPSQKMSAALRTPALTNYRAQLRQHQSAFMANARQAIGRDLNPSMAFNLAYNGMVVSLTEDEANKLLNQPQVMRVIKEVPSQLMTDNGPDHIGAAGIWDGTETGIAAKGEGIIVGVFDTGVNTDNRAFAATGDDGYTVINPMGSGNYLGDCQANSALCNDKLIGVYSFPDITDDYDGIRPANGEDYNGHGSHTASTAAGNVLRDVDVLAPSRGPVGDGTPVGTVFPQISGVAPHANVISYQVCSNSGCYPSLTVASVEQAIEDGVDVINYSIGPSGGFQGDPWLEVEQVAFLSARQAGIFVAQAAGNDGNGGRSSTTGNNAPWATIVGAVSHKRIWTHPVEGTSSASGDLPEFDGYAGIRLDGGAVDRPLNAVIEPKEVVYAGDYTDRYGNNLALCDIQVASYDPVARDLHDKVVICDRGDVPLERKVRNLPYGFNFANGFVSVAGVIIRSTASSEQNMVSINYTRPTALINRYDGDDLMTWLRDAQAAGDTPMLTIGAAVPKYLNNVANKLASFSSRGPYARQQELLVPHISAPGVEVFAAYSDEQPFHGNNGAPSDFQFLSGTSMASPHVAGAAALMQQVHPDWTPAEIQSAMMLTADTQVTKNDDGAGDVTAGLFDTGAGALRLDRAVQAGLIMDIPIDDYMAVSPHVAGDYPSLNMPYLANINCPGSCTWTRTFKATKSGSWSATTLGNAEGVSTSISPANFEVEAGETVTVKITANIAQRATEDWSFLHVALTPSDSSPTLTMPLAIKPMIADIPKTVSRDYFWSKGVANIPGLRFRYPNDAFVTSTPLLKATSHNLELTSDSDNSSPFDDVNDGTAMFFIDIEQSSDLRVVVGASHSDDIDLFVGLDSNGDGTPQVIEITQVCATVANVGESCGFNAGEGRYWVLAHNYEGSGADKDEVRIDVILDSVATKHQTMANLTGDNLEPYEVTSLDLDWMNDLDNGVYYGQVELFDRTSATGARSMGVSQVQLNRTMPTATVSVIQPELSRAQVAEMSVMVPANPTPEELSYIVTLEMDASLQIDSASSADEAAVSTNTNGFSVTLPAGSEGATVMVKLSQANATTGEFPINWNLTSDKAGFDDLQGTAMLSNSNHAPVLSVNQNIDADMDTSMQLNINGSDEDGDALSYSMVQTSGPTVAIDLSQNGVASLQLPNVDQDRKATFTVTVSDGEFSQSEEVNMTIRKPDTSGGAMGFGLGLGLLALAGLRRKPH